MARRADPEPGPPLPLAEEYDAFLFDLDGVLYRGDRPVSAAAEAVAWVRDLGGRAVFVTNNSSRTPEEVAAKLAAVGVEADPADVVTSALATAERVAELSGRRGTNGAPRGVGGDGAPTAFVIGETGIRSALHAAGVQILDGEPERTDFVVVGFDRAADYARLRTAALLVQRGARLVATNADASYPAPDGLWPGAGAILAAITTTVGRPADEVVGKPHPALYRVAHRVAGGGRPLVVGDRLDTDVAGAIALGWDCVVVFTGVSTPDHLMRAPELPTFVGPDLDALRRPAVRLEPARPGDAPAIEALLADARLATDGVAERIDDTLVGREGGRVVATAALELLGDVAHLRSVALREDHRGRHLGALLVATAARHAASRGATTLYAVTETADAFFRSLGFEPIGGKDALPRAVAETPMVRDHCATSSAALRFRLAA